MTTLDHSTHVFSTETGIRVVNIQIPNYPVSTTSVWVNAGSWLDPVGKQGLSHFFEHLLCTKTAQYPDRVTRLAEIEGNGLYFNAFTSLQTQHYFYVHPQDKSQRALELLIDGLAHTEIDEGDLSAEKKIIFAEERENFNDPASYIWRLANKGLWGEGSLGKDFYGTKDSIASITLSDFNQFFAQNFSPEQLLFVCINSALSQQTQIDLIDGMQLEASEDVRQEPVTNQKSAVIFEQRSIDNMQLSLSFQTVPQAEKSERVVQEFLANYLAGSWTSQLVRRLRIEKNYTYWVNADAACLEKTGYLRFLLAIQPENLAEVLEIFEDEIMQLHRSFINPEQLQQCQTKIVSQTLRNAVDYTWLMQWYGYSYLLTNEVLTVEEYCQQILSLTSESIQRFAARYLTKENFSLAYIGREELLKDLPIFKL